MKTSRGRFNQYKILCADETLRTHIVKTELFSKQSLLNMLDLNEPIIIKAVYNSEEICIVYKYDQYHIQTSDKAFTIQDKEALYLAIKNEMTQKYYIIQKSPTANDIFRHLVTMRRNTPLSEWYVAMKTKKIRTTFNPLMGDIYYKKIEQVVIRAATKLGESFPDCNLIVLDIACDWRRNIWINDSTLHFSNSKWSQYHILSKKRLIRKYLPYTDLLTIETFSYNLYRYKSIVLKPCIGQNGIGIVQISRKYDSTFEIHDGIKKLTKPSLDEAFDYINKSYLSKREYIVQQRIALATINNCPIDIRVVTQKMGEAWSVTGKVVKVAGEQFIITNAAQKILPLDQAIHEAKLPKNYIKNLVPQLNNICLMASDLLEENNEGVTIIGFDIGITNIGALWIIEGNKVPDIQMFNELEDKTMYHTILDVRNMQK